MAELTQRTPTVSSDTKATASRTALLSAHTWRRLTAALACGLLPLLVGARADAGDRLCDTRKENCRTPLLTLINNEPAGGGIDVAFWYMIDDRYRSALQAALQRGVRVRVIVDPRATNTYPNNGPILNNLKAAGIPMRMKSARSSTDILHWKMMYFEKQSNNKPVVEFSSANYTPDSFVPAIPYWAYMDEVVYFTDDPRLTNSFATKFEDFWTDTTGNFVDYANITGPQSRYYPIYTPDPALNFPPTQDYGARAVAQYNREPDGVNGGKIDVIMYRISDARHPDAMLEALGRGILVRMITDQLNYRDTRYIWHSYSVDRMYAAGIPIKDHVNGKSGIMHQKSVILYGQKQVIFGSSNWTSASAKYQTEHNLFSKPCTAGQTTWCDGGGPNGNPASWVFNWFVQQFNDKWNNVNPTGAIEFRPFVPLPGGTPVNSAPANGAGGVTTTNLVVLKWDGGNWNHKYDVYLGRTPTLTAADKIASDIMVGSPVTGKIESWTVPTTLAAGTTYYWRVVGKTMADLAKSGPVWSFTTAGTSAGSTPTPYTGVPVSLPGRIEAENFDNGGQAVAYSDSTPGNTGGVYRPGNVDLAAFSSAGNGHVVGWTKPGEWLRYSVSVGASRTYAIELRVASRYAGATLHVEVDGVNKTGTLTVPNTGGWDTWQLVVRSGVSLSAGQHVVRVVFDTQASNGSVGNLDWIQIQ